MQEQYAGRWPMANNYYWSRSRQREEFGIEFFWTTNLASGVTAWFANVPSNTFNAVAIDQFKYED